ncbi:hypothetical protein HPB48_000340 [Haemaphysalis longicornis]|uniref:Small ribosomal subunit protein uS17 n=1 Tax=Haemaphysalis longicornis TaxID=44386 RepID=A0A9J6GVK0_HAELO|nr:hypothetical protein HPB48_000340 [Haemaphysalis longicornis]
MAEQVERAFQKQPTVFLNRKAGLPKGNPRRVQRYYKSVGLGFKTPREAIHGTYIDKKCPFTGASPRFMLAASFQLLWPTSSNRQREHPGPHPAGGGDQDEDAADDRDRRDYLHYVRKYNRFEKRHRNMSVHLSPAFRDVAVGDVVTVGECRPLSKTVRFNVLKVTKAAGSKKQFLKA